MNGTGHASGHRTGYLLGISLVAGLGGLLFGYDLVVIGGAKEFYELAYGLSDPVIKGWAVSSCIVGCIIGALGVGKPADVVGRKPMLWIPSSTTRNSSPPMRAMRSESRVAPLIRRAVSRKITSPTTWPRESLMLLKWSTSQNTTADSAPG